MIASSTAKSSNFDINLAANVKTLYVPHTMLNTQIHGLRSSEVAVPNPPWVIDVMLSRR